jgi:SAM-dependent methyltransferase
MDHEETIRYYERAGRHYATLIGPEPNAFRAAALQRLVEPLAPGEVVLEIGSGPGRDADHLETLGVPVDRTDAAETFLRLQAERGKRARRLDVTTDELGGPYGGVLALCVLMHVSRASMDRVLGKVAAALRPGGGFLVSVRAGEGETAPPAAMAFWSREDFEARLRAADFVVEWFELEIDCGDDAWLTFYARTPATSSTA